MQNNNMQNAIQKFRHGIFLLRNQVLKLLQDPSTL